MKYEEIKVGESYKVNRHTIKVIEKNNEHKAVMTIDEDGIIFGWNEDELELFQPIKKELPESGLLVCTDGAIVYRTDLKKGFGFLYGNFHKRDDWSFITLPDQWRTATPEEEAKFIELLKQEAEKRGLGVDAKTKMHADGDNTMLNKNFYAPRFALTEAWNKHGQIFKKGIWAEPLTMLDEVTEVIKKHLPNIVVEQVDGVVTLKEL